MLPHLTNKALKAYSPTKLIAFPIPLSPFPVVLPSGNTVKVQDFVVPLLQGKQDKDGPRSQSKPYSKAWEY